MLQPAAWAHSSSPLYHLARVLSASNNTSEVLALSHCINTGPRKSQNSTRCRALLLWCFNVQQRHFSALASTHGPSNPSKKFGILVAHSLNPSPMHPRFSLLPVPTTWPKL